MEHALREAQERLELKPDSLKQTGLVPIGLGRDKGSNPPICEECGDEIILSEADKAAEESFIRLRAMFGDDDPGRSRLMTICSSCAEKKLHERKERDRQRELDYKERIKHERRQKRLSSCGIGERFMGVVWEDYVPINAQAEKVLQECQLFVENFNPSNSANLLLIGSPGTGKNMLAAIIGQEVIKKDFSFCHTTALRCVRKIKDSWRDKEIEEQEVIDSFTDPDLLVIDEVGVQFGSPTELLYLTEIINDRYEKRRSTILISNLTVKQLEEIIGARIMDRFYEGESKFLVFNWASYRRQKKGRD